MVRFCFNNVFSEEQEMPNTILRNKLFLFLFTGSLLVLRMSTADGAGEATLGINYDVVHTDTSLVGQCKADANATVHQKVALTRYGDPEIQKAVREDLADMNRPGFRSIRTIVQLVPGANPAGNLIDTANVDDSVLSKVRDYLRDFQSAGFNQVILAFGAQGAGNPACAKSQWGDCFDPKTVAATVSAEAKIIAVAHSVKGLALRVDLLNEACPSKSGP